MERREYVRSLFATALLGGYSGCSAPTDSADQTQPSRDTRRETPLETPERERSAKTGSTAAVATTDRPGTTAVTCNQMMLPNPNSSTDGGIPPTDYPEYPDEPSKTGLEAFAVEFERAYRRNVYVAEHQHGNAPGLDVDAGAAETFTREDAVIVAIIGDLATGGVQTTLPGTATPERFPALDLPFATWYRFTPDRVERLPAGTELPDPLEVPSFDVAATVLCP